MSGRIEETIAELHLQNVADEYISELSSTDVRLLSIAIAIVYNPTVIIIDEPISSLDTVTATHVSIYLYIRL